MTPSSKSTEITPQAGCLQPWPPHKPLSTKQAHKQETSTASDLRPREGHPWGDRGSGVSPQRPEHTFEPRAEGTGKPWAPQLPTGPSCFWETGQSLHAGRAQVRHNSGLSVEVAWAEGGSVNEDSTAGGVQVCDGQTTTPVHLP